MGMVWIEAQFVEQRLNQEEASRAILTQLAVSSAQSKKALSAFNKAIKKLNDGS